MSVRGQSLGMGEGSPGTQDQDVSWWMDSHGVAVFARPLLISIAWGVDTGGDVDGALRTTRHCSWPSLRVGG
jgi:hypothetical protein